MSDNELHDYQAIGELLPKQIKLRIVKKDGRSRSASLNFLIDGDDIDGERVNLLFSNKVLMVRGEKLEEIVEFDIFGKLGKLCVYNSEIYKPLSEGQSVIHEIKIISPRKFEQEQAKTQK